MRDFFITTDNKIWKNRPKHNDWYLISPSEDKIKVVFDADILSMEGNFVNENKGNELNNKLWREYNPVWEYNGKKYTTKENDGICLKIPKHFTNDDVFIGGLMLCMFNGKLKWAYTHSTYYPRVEIFDVNNGENFPKMITFIEGAEGSFEDRTIWHGGWTHIKNIKPIYCITDKKFV